MLFSFSFSFHFLSFSFPFFSFSFHYLWSLFWSLWKPTCDVFLKRLIRFIFLAVFLDVSSWEANLRGFLAEIKPFLGPLEANLRCFLVEMFEIWA